MTGNTEVLESRILVSTDSIYGVVLNGDGALVVLVGACLVTAPARADLDLYLGLAENYFGPGIASCCS